MFLLPHTSAFDTIDTSLVWVSHLKHLHSRQSRCPQVSEAETDTKEAVTCLGSHSK
jgi:hypothetical protein